MTGRELSGVSVKGEFLYGMQTEERSPYAAVCHHIRVRIPKKGTLMQPFEPT